MAISDTKQDLLLGQSVAEMVANGNENFNTLFDNDDDLQTQVDGKEAAFTKNTAFNKNFYTGTPKMNGTGSAGSATTVARGDHVHPTDTSRLAAAPDGTNALLDSDNKIQSVYLPDSVLGNLAYQGTFNASAGSGASGTQSKGYYYICATAGSKNPDGTTPSWLSSLGSYQVGDWAVYNGSSWDKVDNTDAVTLVNGQLGSVETYKGAYSASTAYYKGDTVLGSDSNLYLCLANSTGNDPTTSATYFKIYGKVYTEATTTDEGLMSSADKTKIDGIAEGAEVNQNAFSNVTVGSTTIAAASATDTLTLAAGSNISLTPDATNKKVTIKCTYSLPSTVVLTTGEQTITGNKTFSCTDTIFKGDVTFNDGISVDEINTANDNEITLNKNTFVNGTLEVENDITCNNNITALGGTLTAKDGFEVDKVVIDYHGMITQTVGGDETSEYTYTLPEKTGTLALTSNIPTKSFISVTTDDTRWTTKAVNGTTYQAIQLSSTLAVLNVYNSDGEQIVIQPVYDTSGYIYICVGTSKQEVTIEAISWGE